MAARAPRWIDRALQLGVDAPAEVDVRKRIRLANLLALWACAIMLPWTAVEVVHGEPENLPIEVAFLAAFGAVLALNARRAHRAARLLLVLTANACVFAGALMFDAGAGGTLPFFALVALPLLLFGPGERVMLGLGAGMPILLFVACETGLATRLLGVAPRAAPGWYFAANAASAFAVAFVVPFFFYRSNLRAEASLERMAQEKLQRVVDENVAMMRQSEEALRLRDLFSSIASHELKTPLTGLMLSLQTLRRRVDREAAAESPLRTQLERCQAAAARMGDLIHALLDVAQVRDGKLELALHQTDVVAAVQRAASAFEPNGARSGGAGQEIAVRAEEPVSAILDPLRFDQVVTNLLSNAVKYGDGKPIEVRVGVRHHDGAGDQAHVEVIDHGPGIEPAMASKIFQPFERAVAPGASIPGLGLGLYVVKMIVEGHGGHVDVDSELGHGARFSVDFPCVAAPQPFAAH